MGTEEKNRDPGPLPWAEGEKSRRNRKLSQQSFLEIDLRYYFRLLAHHVWLILFCLIVFLALGAFQLKRTTPRYSSTAQIMYEPSRTKVLDLDMQLGARPHYFRIDEMETAVEMIRSPKVAQAVIDSLGLYASRTNGGTPVVPRDESPLATAKQFVIAKMEFLQSKLVNLPPTSEDSPELKEQNRVLGLLGQVAVRQRHNTKILEITVTDTTPEQAKRIADEFANQFIVQVNHEQEQAFNYAREYLQKQIRQTELQLVDAEKELHRFNSKSDLMAMEETHSVSVNTMVDLTKQIEETKNEIALYLAQEESASTGEVRRTLLQDDVYYGELLRKLGELQVRRISLSAENEPALPELRRIDLEIVAMQGQITSATATLSGEIGSRLQIARIREKHLAERLDQQKNKVHGIEGEMIEYRMLKRQVETTREIHDGLLDQYKRLDVADGLSYRDASLVAAGAVPRNPSSPKIGSTFSKFGFMGIIIGVGLVFLLAWFDRSVRNPSVVEERLELPTLGTIPYLGKRKRMPRVFSRKRLPIPLTVEHHPRAAIGREAFRYLRTSLEYSTAEHPPRVIMTTSCVPEEGKSTICSNLASIFAEKGVKTLVIDADLRRPILHKAFGQSRCPGLSDVLTGQRSYADAIVPLDIPNLHFLPAGPGTPSPLNLLDSQSMSTLLEELKNEFAVIILDSAPCDAVADSLVLAQKVDGVCLVVSLGSTSLEVLDSTVGRLQSMDTCILGVIYNRAKAEVLASSYGYSYGYGKQYGKGYGHPYVNPPSEKTS